MNGRLSNFVQYVLDTYVMPWTFILIESVCVVKQPFSVMLDSILLHYTYLAKEYILSYQMDPMEDKQAFEAFWPFANRE